MATTLKVIDATVRAPQLLWDTIWNGQVGDWAPAAPNEPSNRGGLRARVPIATAILLCWMSDARADPSDAIPDGTDDPRGWPGDAVDPDCDPIGSKLWLLRRHTLTDDTANLAVLYGQAALQTLIKQKVCARIDVTARVNLDVGRLELFAQAFERDGTKVADVQYDLLWKQNQASGPYPLDP